MSEVLEPHEPWQMSPLLRAWLRRCPAPSVRVHYEVSYPLQQSLIQLLGELEDLDE